MTHFHDEIRLEVPVDQVWALFLDTSHWQEWMPRRETSHVSGPLDEVGTTYVQRTRLLGLEMKWACRVVEVEPQRLIRVHSDYGPTDTTFRFEPDGQATRLLVDSEHELPGGMPGFIEDLMSTSWMERNVRRVFHDVVEHPEEDPL